MPDLMRRQQRAPQRGATLIELLVSFLIISFGMLALLALQNNAIQYNKTTEYRSLATMHATDLAERMRANKAQALAGTYNITGSATASTTLPTRVACGKSATEVCSPATLAAQELSEWQRLLAMSLPGGRAHVEVVNDATRPVASTVNIWVAWDDPSGGNEIVGDTDAKTKECATALIPTDSKAPTPPPAPRCAFFNIAL